MSPRRPRGEVGSPLCPRPSNPNRPLVRRGRGCGCWRPGPGAHCSALQADGLERGSGRSVSFKVTLFSAASAGLAPSPVELLQPGRERVPSFPPASLSRPPARELPGRQPVPRVAHRRGAGSVEVRRTEQSPHRARAPAGTHPLHKSWIQVYNLPAFGSQNLEKKPTQCFFFLILLMISSIKDFPSKKK